MFILYIIQSHNRIALLTEPLVMDVNKVKGFKEKESFSVNDYYGNHMWKE